MYFLGELIVVSTYAELKNVIAGFEIDTITSYCIDNETKAFKKDGRLY